MRSGVEAQFSRRDSLRTTSPAPIRVPPPTASRTTSRPVKGSVPAELACVEELGVTEHNCGLYAWHVELLCARAVPDMINAIPTASIAIRFMRAFLDSGVMVSSSPRPPRSGRVSLPTFPTQSLHELPYVAAISLLSFPVLTGLNRFNDLHQHRRRRVRGGVKTFHLVGTIFTVDRGKNGRRRPRASRAAVRHDT
jgi:hypothetical protein